MLAGAWIYEAERVKLVSFNVGHTQKEKNRDRVEVVDSDKVAAQTRRLSKFAEGQCL